MWIIPSLCLFWKSITLIGAKNMQILLDWISIHVYNPFRTIISEHTPVKILLCFNSSRIGIWHLKYLSEYEKNNNVSVCNTFFLLFIQNYSTSMVQLVVAISLITYPMYLLIQCTHPSLYVCSPLALPPSINSTTANQIIKSVWQTLFSINFTVIMFVDVFFQYW